MKKVISLGFVLVLLMCSFILPAGAQTLPAAQETVVEVEYFPDGSRMETTLTVTTLNTRAASKQGHKSRVFYDSSDNWEWTYHEYANFTYTGSSATCTGAWSDWSGQSNWKLYSENITRSGNSASYDYVVKRYWLGAAMQTVTDFQTMYCSGNGTIS